MKTLSVKKFSILGFFLIAASAVVAAIIPTSKDKDVKDDVVGTLHLSSGDDAQVNTCVVTQNLGTVRCNVSATTDTSVHNGVGANTTSSENPTIAEGFVSTSGTPNTTN